MRAVSSSVPPSRDVRLIPATLNEISADSMVVSTQAKIPLRSDVTVEFDSAGDERRHYVMTAKVVSRIRGQLTLAFDPSNPQILRALASLIADWRQDGNGLHRSYRGTALSLTV